MKNNINLEQKLAQREEELANVRQLLKSLTEFKENIKHDSNTIQSCISNAGTIQSEKLTKTPKRVTFVDDVANQTIIEADL